MSSETNKLLCAILTAFLFLLLTSFVGDLIYHTDKKVESLSYFVEENNVTNTSNLELTNEEQKITVSKKDIENMLDLADVKAGEKFAKKNCSTCHKFDLPKKNKIGPSLAMLLNRKIASINDYKYSNSLKEKNGLWDIENLYFFLEKPKEWAPGTKMSYKGVKKQQDLINLIKYVSLNTSSNAN